ncbi:DUF4097 family beta strand repeat-containing protein [Streptomyces sp. NPDC097619]|uniref:DUF4097 family beta strand repeat-containing protein n=1 Tax=Streptomyces sp. NPDC097619 TaxID=3157228 RepID=UPI003320E9A3
MTQTWSVSEPQKLSFEEPVTGLSVRLVNGAVNVVAVEEGPARLEVSHVEGPPLLVTHEDGLLTVAYEDLPWSGLKNALDRSSWQRTAVVSLAVPAGTGLRFGAVGATGVVSGLGGPVEARTVSGDLTLVGLSGAVGADTVSGTVEAQSVTGDLRVRSVSGELTVIDGGGPSVRAESVSGDMLVDLAAGGAAEISLASVSGEVAIRLPRPTDARVDANTAGGSVSNAFDDLRVSGRFGAKRITGTLGAGTGSLKATTVSGSIALLRRPDGPDGPEETAPAAPLDLDKKVL